MNGHDAKILTNSKEARSIFINVRTRFFKLRIIAFVIIIELKRQIIMSSFTQFHNSMDANGQLSFLIN